MKKTLLALTLSFILATTAWALENPWDRKLPFKNATINYKIDGQMKGSKTIYVTDYGRNSAEYSDTSMTVFGMTQKQQEIIITSPDWVFTIDLTNATGTKQANPNKYLKEKFAKLSASEKKKVIKNAEQTGIAMTGEMGGEVEKNAAKLLGYSCDKATIVGTTVYTISGTDLPLKIESNMMGVNMIETATGIDKGKPAAAKFKVPSGIRIEHDPAADRMIKEQAEMTIEGLLTGTAPAAGVRPSGGGAGQDDLNQLTPEQQQQMQQMLKMFGN